MSIIFRIFLWFQWPSCVEKSLKNIPYDLAIKHAQYMRFLSLWFDSVLGLYIVDFETQYGSQPVRIVVASATSNAGIPYELWGQHGDSASLKSLKGI